jgi:hypothetical protein
LISLGIFFLEFVKRQSIYGKIIRAEPQRYEMFHVMGHSQSEDVSVSVSVSRGERNRVWTWIGPTPAKLFTAQGQGHGFAAHCFTETLHLQS